MDCSLLSVFPCRNVFALGREVAVYAALISFLALPVLALLNESSVVENPLYLALVGVVSLVAVFGLAFKLIYGRLPAESRDSYIAWFTVFAFTCVVDLLLAFEIDWNIGIVSW